LYGTCTASKAASVLKSSIPRWAPCPEPADAYAISGFFDFANATNSLTVVTVDEELTLSRKKLATSCVTGAKSLTGS
jgi:hypothetical protein